MIVIILIIAIYCPEENFKAKHFCSKKFLLQDWLKTQIPNEMYSYLNYTTEIFSIYKIRAIN